MLLKARKINSLQEMNNAVKIRCANENLSNALNVTYLPDLAKVGYSEASETKSTLSYTSLMYVVKNHNAANVKFLNASGMDVFFINLLIYANRLYKSIFI